MNKSKSKIKILIPLCMVLLIAAIVVGFVFYPKATDNKFESFSFVAENQQNVEFSADFTEKLNNSVGFVSVDKKSSAVVLGTQTSIFNCFSEDAASGKLANVIDVALRDESNNRYVMNSTDNSVAFRTFSFENSGSKFEFDFALYPNKTESEKGEGASVWVKIPVEISIENGGFKIKTDLSSVQCKDGFVIEQIRFLPGLFSVSSSRNMKYYLPQGSGAEIALDAVSEKDFISTLSVYGEDISFGEYDDGAVLPCFAFSNGNTLVSTIIDAGDALSKISVFKEKNGNCKLYNTFTVTAYSVVDGKVLKGDSYTGELSQIYYLTENKNNDYNDLAEITRDFLVDKKYLPSVFSDEFGDFPFFITAIGSESGKGNNSFTTFENASEIIALLKSRGVRSVALRFAGGGKNGLNSSAANSVKLSEKLGGKEGYKELCKTASQNNSSVWLDVNLANSSSSGERKGTDVYSRLRKYFGENSVNSKMLSYFAVENNISSVYKAMDEFEESNLSLNDLSFLLYTDIDGGINRQLALESIREKTEALSLGGGLMLESPAVYLMNNADCIFNMPEKTNYEGVEGATSVPLLQMVLHGSVLYGTQPVNLNTNGLDAVLKAVEYGACPSFVFTHNDGGALDYGPYAYQIAKYYSLVKQMMPLMDMKITGHEKVVSGVYKTTYDYSKIVYVNYNPSVVEVNGILISSKDFVII